MKYFDCTKKYFLLHKFSNSDKLSFLMQYKEHLINSVFRIKDMVLNREEINRKEELAESLSQYIRNKFYFKKENYFREEKYYPKSSLIDLKALKMDLDDGELDYKSITAKAAEIGVSYTTLHKNITKILGYKYSSANQLNFRREKVNKYGIIEIFLIKRFQLLKISPLLIYIDESSFNNTKRKRRKWIKKASQNHFYDHGRIKSMNLILAISNKKVMNYFINKRNNNSTTFTIFLKNLKKNVLSSKDTKSMYDNNKICIIMDNATIHKTNIVKDYLNSTKFQVLYLPPYFPDLNSAEFAFRNMKIKFYKRDISHQ